MGWISLETFGLSHCLTVRLYLAEIVEQGQPLLLLQALLLPGVPQVLEVLLHPVPPRLGLAPLQVGPGGSALVPGLASVPASPPCQ